MFKKLEGDQALLLGKGVYKEAQLFEFQGGLYAKYGSGYVRLKANGTTSNPSLSFCHLETEAILWSDSFGRIALVERDRYKPLTITNKDDGETLLLSKG